MQIEGKIILQQRRIALMFLCSLSLLTYIVLQFFIPPLLSPQPFLIMVTVLMIFGAELRVSERLSQAVLTNKEICVTIAYGFGAIKTKTRYTPTDDFILQVQFFMAEGVKTIGFPLSDHENHCKIIFQLDRRNSL